MHKRKQGDNIKIKISVVWGTMSRSPLQIKQCLEEPSYLQSKSRKKQNEATSKQDT
jgi:hypothetical protein